MWNRWPDGKTSDDALRFLFPLFVPHLSKTDEALFFAVRSRDKSRYQTFSCSIYLLVADAKTNASRSCPMSFRQPYASWTKAVRAHRLASHYGIGQKPVASLLTQVLVLITTPLHGQLHSQAYLRTRSLVLADHRDPVHKYNKLFGCGWTFDIIDCQVANNRFLFENVVS